VGGRESGEEGKGRGAARGGWEGRKWEPEEGGAVVCPN